MNVENVSLKEPSIIFLVARNAVAARYLCIYAGKIYSLKIKERRVTFETEVS